MKFWVMLVVVVAVVVGVAGLYSIKNQPAEVITPGTEPAFTLPPGAPSVQEAPWLIKTPGGNLVLAPALVNGQPTVLGVYWDWDGSAWVRHEARVNRHYPGAQVIRR